MDVLTETANHALYVVGNLFPLPETGNWELSKQDHTTYHWVY